MLHVHRAERADVLAEALALELGPPLADPFVADVVAVPTRGVERWLAQRLSHSLGVRPRSPGGLAERAPASDGICANVRFPSPSLVVSEALAAVGAAAEADPWEPDRMRWPLLDVIDESVGEPWCEALSGYLGAGEGETHRRGRRLWVAGHLAGLFATYGAERPEMVCQWAGLDAGPETGLEPGPDPLDGFGVPLAPDVRWQVELWKRLRDRIGSPSPAERLGPGCDRLRAEPDLVALPQRLSVFGPTRLSRAQLSVLAALSRHRDVHLWLPHPSPTLWAALEPLAAQAARSSRALDPTRSVPRNRLLSSFGRDSRELQLRLAAVHVPTADHHHPRGDGAAPPHLLGLLQRAVRDDRPPPLPGERTALAATDRSVTVHACHGPGRQVEVLREELVGMLADDPTLEPRDIVVMCPDIEQYAPLISAAFGLHALWTEPDEVDVHPAQRLRVRLADRSLRQTNPVLGTLASVIDLADSRLAAGPVLDLASRPPVRRRFRFDDEDYETVAGWLRESGVRWGLDLRHRRSHGLDLAQNTWRAGLDRILLGAAMDDDGSRWVGLALPLDDVDSTDIELAGRFAEFLDRLTTVTEQLTGTRPLAAWLAALEAALDLLTEVSQEDAWQTAQARRVLAEVGAESAASSSSAAPLTLHDIRTLLSERLQGRPTRANFRTGELTVCSMVPMRSVPHRVVCLLGLDDGSFPRAGNADGDDLLGVRPHVGERDARGEDRQLLLDAVLAADERLVVLYTGSDPRTNAHHPPAVPVAEVLDAVDALATAPDGQPVVTHVLIRHPLQPFDRRNFIADALGRPGPFSFDRQAYGGALRMAQPRQPRPPFLAEPVPPPAAAPGVAPDAPDLELDDLVAFLESPARGFLRGRLGISLFREEDDLPDELPVELDGLQRWEVGDRMLQAALSGSDLDRAKQAEWRRGTLPPGALGSGVLEQVGAEVGLLVTAAQPYGSARRGAVDPVDVAVALDAGTRRLVGTVTVHGSVLLRVVYSRLAAKHRLRAWVQLLALSASEIGSPPAAEWTAVTIGRGQKGARTARLGSVPPTQAKALLTDLVALYDRGMAEVLPMAAKTSARYAEKRDGGMNADNALRAAATVWEGSWTLPGERADAEHEQVYGKQAPFGALTGGRRPTPFEVLALRLWEPLLGYESLVGR